MLKPDCRAESEKGDCRQFHRPRWYIILVVSLLTSLTTEHRRKFQNDPRRLTIVAHVSHRLFPPRLEATCRRFFRLNDLVQLLLPTADRPAEADGKLLSEMVDNRTPRCTKSVRRVTAMERHAHPDRSLGPCRPVPTETLSAKVQHRVPCQIELPTEIDGLKRTHSSGKVSTCFNEFHRSLSDTNGGIFNGILQVLRQLRHR